MDILTYSLSCLTVAVAVLAVHVFRRRRAARQNLLRRLYA